MLKFFNRNIDNRGRIIRGVMGIALVFAGVFMAGSWWLRSILLVAGGFGLVEAVRGWCFMRACGIKTKF